MKPLLFCALLSLSLWSGGNLVGRPQDPTAVPASMSLPKRVATELVKASPLADPADAKARDRASEALARCQSFRMHVGERILWGGCDPEKGFDPKTYSLTKFDPVVWLKLYASTIMFTGESDVRQEGPLTILELKARFRSGLDPGDYPYPFWHTPKKWQAYLDLTSLALVFREDTIVAAYRIAPNKASGVGVAADMPSWDGKWRWTDAKGEEQPRVALFSYVFSPDNPHREAVDQSYRRLEAKFRSQNCTACHAPDNKGKAKSLLLLNYPNQSLAARHSLVEVLKKNEMPPEDTTAKHAAGIADEAVRGELVGLAEAFVKQADAAIAFESRR